MGKGKICIVTFNGGANYGSKLQATALSKFLEERGYEVSFLSHLHITKMLFAHPSLLFARVLNRFNEKKRKKFFAPCSYQISEERKIRLEEYDNDNLKKIAICSNKQWQQVIDDNTIFIAGSDIIWQPSNGYPAKYFLDYVYYTNLRRFSYATSFGALELPQKYFHAYKKYLNAYDGVSVREESAAKMLENIIGRRVNTVVDPTILLTKEKWDKFAHKAQFSISIPDKYILCYFVMNDQKYWDYIKKIEEKESIPVVVLPMHQIDEEQPYIVIEDGTPYEFIKLIKNAEFICTDSFHACVFSTIYEKEFYLLRRSRKDEDAKYDDFLTRYGLSIRRIENEDLFIRDSNLDFSKAEEQMEKDRNYSINYIDTCLVDH